MEASHPPAVLIQEDQLNLALCAGDGLLRVQAVQVVRWRVGGPSQAQWPQQRQAKDRPPRGGLSPERSGAAEMGESVPAAALCAARSRQKRADPSEHLAGVLHQAQHPISSHGIHVLAGNWTFQSSNLDVRPTFSTAGQGETAPGLHGRGQLQHVDAQQPDMD